MQYKDLFSVLCDHKQTDQVKQDLVGTDQVKQDLVGTDLVGTYALFARLHYLPLGLIMSIESNKILTHYLISREGKISEL